MKKLISISLLVAFCVQIFIQSWIVQYYQLNKEYISEVLCINKNKPAMHCDGKCFLKKELEKQEEQESKLPFSIKEKLERELFVENYAHIFNRYFPLALKITFPPYCSVLFPNPSFDILHPPQIV